MISGRLRSKDKPDKPEAQLSMEAMVAHHSSLVDPPPEWQKAFSIACGEPAWTLHTERFNDENDQQLQPVRYGMSLGDLLDISREHPSLITPILGQALVADNALSRRIKRKKRRVKLCDIGDLLRDIHIPNTIFEVLKHEFSDQFLDACEEELDSHVKKGTWDPDLVPRMEGMNVVDCTWAFDIKRDMKLKIARFKARLCARGYSQVKGIDWFRKHSHAVPLDIFRLFLAKMAQLGYEVTEIDYKTAYLNAKLDVDVYMKQPKGYEAVDENGDILTGPNGEELVCKLIRAIYGLLQSGLMWEEEHHDTLREENWEQCESEVCLFKKTVDGQTYYLCTYVDNCYLGFPPGSKERENTVKALAGHYELTDLGEVCYSIGARIMQNPRLKQTSIHQKPMIDNIVEDYKQFIVEPKRKSYRSIPYDPDDPVTRSEPDHPSVRMWQEKCLKLGGRINYVAVFTRPDISRTSPQLYPFACSTCRVPTKLYFVHS